jgi:hypothetical protein
VSSVFLPAPEKLARGDAKPTGRTRPRHPTRARS